MVGIGLSPTDALRSAMTVAAKTLGLEDEIGRIAAGYAADVIAVEGNPLEDIRVMEDVRCVMRDGRVVKAPQERPYPIATLEATDVRFRAIAG